MRKSYNILIVLLFVVIGALVIYATLLNHRIRQNESDHIEQLNEHNKLLQTTQDSINEVRETYQDSLYQVRLEEFYYVEMMDSLDSVLATIPKRYEQDRITASHSADGTLVILSNY